MVRELFRSLASGAALVLLSPLLAWSRLPLGEQSRFTAPSQLLALVPGVTGILLRRVWYRRTLRRCGERLTVDWLAVIRISDAEVGDRVTFGVGNWIGLARVGSDVMTGSHVIVTSGAGQHGFGDLSRPIREQGGSKRQVIIGDDCWIGAQSVLMADVAPHTVIGAGSVVTRTFAPGMVIAGSPARVLRPRQAEAAAK
jgi:acetyltransferase-like isoleucine patch superfamily enzyme